MVELVEVVRVLVPMEICVVDVDPVGDEKVGPVPNVEVPGVEGRAK